MWHASPPMTLTCVCNLSRLPLEGVQRSNIFIISTAAAGRCYTRERLRLWWSLTTADGVGTAGQSVRLFLHFRPWSAVATAGAFHAYSLEQRRALSAAAGWLECAHGTDKVPGEPELSRPMARAAPTPSKGMCALHVCRCAVA